MANRVPAYGRTIRPVESFDRFVAFVQEAQAQLAVDPGVDGEVVPVERKDRILDRRAYEFFVDRFADGKATWSGRVEDRGVVYTFPSGWVSRHVHPYAWHPSVVYYAPPGLYLMANWGMGCSPTRQWFGKPSYLGFWTAPQPWGPFTQVHEETTWTPAGDEDARAYQPQISPKWIAQDGLSFWLVWTDFQDVDGRGKPYYAFNMQQVAVAVE